VTSKDVRSERKKQLKAKKGQVAEAENKLKDHVNASFFYWVMWFIYLIGALIGCLLHIVLSWELYALVPVMLILALLIAADIYADF